MDTDVSTCGMSSKAAKDAKRLDNEGGVWGMGKEWKREWWWVSWREWRRIILCRNMLRMSKGGVPLSFDQFHSCKIITVRYLV